MNPPLRKPGFPIAPGSTPEPGKTHLAVELKHERPLIGCAISQDGKFAFAGSEDESIVRWCLDGEPRKTQGRGHESWVFALAFTPDGKSLLSGGGDGRLVWWDPSLDEMTPARTVQAHEGWINAIAVAPDGQTVATAGNDRLVRIWSVSDGRLMAELPGHTRPVYTLRFLPHGRTLFTADLLGRVVEWDLPIRKEARRLDASKLYKYETGQQVDYGGVRDMCFDPGAKLLACSGLVDASNPLGAVSNPAIVLLDLGAESTEPRLIRPREDVKGVGWSVAWHPAGFLVLASGGTGGGWLWFFNPTNGDQIARTNTKNTARGMALHPDSIRIATAHHDGHLRVWSMSE